MKNKEIDLKVPASLNYSSFVRLLSVELAEGAGFTSKDKNMLKLVVDELFMNAVKYGSNPNSFVYIKGHIEGEAVVYFSLEDEGKGEKKVSKEDLEKIIRVEKRNNDLEKFHGRGLAQITSVLTEKFEISNSEKGGIKVAFSKHRSNEKEKNVYLEEKKRKEEKLKQSKAEIVEKKTFNLIGEIDLLNLEEKTSKIDEYIKLINYPVSITLNCVELDFFNSTCIGKIVYWYGKIHKLKGQLIMTNVSKEIFEILDLVGVREIIKVTVK